MLKIGDRIRQQRKALGLTIKQLHETTGLSVGNISDMENNKFMPSVSSLLPLSIALQCSVDWLLTGNSHPINHEVEQTKHAFTLSVYETELINLFRLLNEHDRGEVFEYMEFKKSRSTE